MPHVKGKPVAGNPDGALTVFDGVVNPETGFDGNYVKHSTNATYFDEPSSYYAELFAYMDGASATGSGA